MAPRTKNYLVYNVNTKVEKPLPKGFLTGVPLFVPVCLHVYAEGLLFSSKAAPPQGSLPSSPL